jgi:hypothetical protein
MDMSAVRYYESSQNLSAVTTGPGTRKGLRGDTPFKIVVPVSTSTKTKLPVAFSPQAIYTD